MPRRSSALAPAAVAALLGLGAGFMLGSARTPGPSAGRSEAHPGPATDGDADRWAADRIAVLEAELAALRARCPQAP